MNRNYFILDYYLLMIFLFKNKMTAKMIPLMMQCLLVNIVRSAYCDNYFSFLTGSNGNIFEDSGVRVVENYLPAGTGYVDVISDFSKYINSMGYIWDYNDFYLYYVNY